VFQISLQPSILKNFLIVPLKATIFEKITFTYTSKFCPLPPTTDNGGKPPINGKDLWQTADHRETPVCTFLPASCGEADQRRKIGGLTVPMVTAITKL
jgi:hypothetical protein